MEKILTEILKTKIGNSLTKYPSIETYHKMGERGCLSDELTMQLPSDTELFVSEKVDGRNTRILILNDDYIIGSREDWIYAKGDRAIPIGEQMKVNFLKNIADRILEDHADVIEPDTLYCIYGELYGSKIQKIWHHYTKANDEFGFRMFDVWKMEESSFNQLLGESTEDSASGWREQNRQPWMSEEELSEFCEAIGVAQTPRLGVVKAGDIGTTLNEAYRFLSEYENTKSQLDVELATAKAEGVVVRTNDRSIILKLRFEDYEKTFKRRV